MQDNKTHIDTKIFKYKLDFYYQQSLFYLMTLILYAGVRGTLSFEKLPSLVSDPLLYIIVLFVLISFVVLFLNKVRDRKLLVTNDKIIFHNKYIDQEIPITDVDWIFIGRERKIQTAGASQIIIFKSKSRRRLYRIRVGRYERDKELLNEIQKITQNVPKHTRPLLGRI